MFDLVVDVAAYPEFLPWCVASRVRAQSDTHVVADLVIGFKMVRERFTSRVALDRDASPSSGACTTCEGICPGYGFY